MGFWLSLTDPDVRHHLTVLCASCPAAPLYLVRHLNYLEALGRVGQAFGFQTFSAFAVLTSIDSLQISKVGPDVVSFCSGTRLAWLLFCLLTSSFCHGGFGGGTS